MTQASSCGFYRAGEYRPFETLGPDWVYDMIVIGGGTGGLVAAGFAGRLGLKVALVEREHLGGDCTWFGCVPSKALLKVAKVAHTVRTASDFGVAASAPRVDMAQVRGYVQQIVEETYSHETPEVYSQTYGVDVFIAEARFTGPNSLSVGGQTLNGKRFVIATGARPSVPPIQGLADVPYLTYRDIFSQDVLPGHLLIIGAGPIGVEMAQAHARLGAQVTLIDAALLPRDEPEVRDVLLRVFEQEGIRFIEGLAASVAQRASGIEVILKNGEAVYGDALLVATGRVPNVDALDLDRAGVVHDANGIQVDRHLRTNVRHIFAVGDVIGGPQFTHQSNFQGTAAAQNALLPLIKTVGIEHDLLPTVTYTEPEIAHVGLTEAKARERHGDRVKAFMYPMTRSDRGRAEGDTGGFIKIVHKNGKLLGVTIMAGRAGEMISEVTVAMKANLSVRQIVSTMHPYPSYNETLFAALGLMLVDELFEGASGRLINAAVNVLY